MKARMRRQEIMDVLMEAGSAGVDDLAARFRVSRMTVHRDLDELEQAGFVRKVRGGASIQASSKFESDFRYRERLAIAEKRHIAAAAAASVEPGQTLMLDDGSTVAAMVEHLVERRPLTVVTGSFAVIRAFADCSGIELIALGGRYSTKFNGFFGLVAEEAIRSLRADVAFLSTSAILGTSAYHQDEGVVQVKRLMMAAAERRCLLADHAKFGRSALHFLADLADFDTVFTGEPLGPAAATPLAAAGIHPEVASAHGEDGHG
ncbi:DeoR/GlpR family DNA-binding transcription regulator [Pararhizobium mangrovi]|uniref:DeoR/GlpR transcriptional regulator n=1 Tax=Pararhizobium mangrovi TaxID=2590452 RepID=A0A506TVS3_9HYPH|nr:DeoR/GlpR family DNA-binding transcription regulator [Pararhizobium mangrovi]TPW26173.1 DeoR/GlpR transcriptional regulator [Pararhizobium mangrovi]